MSEGFMVKSRVHDYQINFVDDFTVPLRKIIKPGDVIFVDENVAHLHKARLEPILNETPHIMVEANEAKKDYKEIGPLIDKLIQQGFSKNNKIIAIGGGITQDIVTFIAANLYRGVEWNFFPTTLLAQGDSCIGGKASINFSGAKNLLGNFYPPQQIFIDLTLLDTLPRKQVISGLGEITHFYYVSGEDDYKLMRDSHAAAFENRAILEKLIHRSLEIKKKTIEIDEFDRKERLLFNYGHSFGHALEAMTRYRVPHGIAVSHGMDVANFISMKMGLIDEGQWQCMRDVLMLNWQEVPLGEIDVDTLIEALRKDKKNIGSEVRVILTRGLGKMFITSLDVDGEGRDWLEEYFADHVYKGVRLRGLPC